MPFHEICDPILTDRSSRGRSTRREYIQGSATETERLYGCRLGWMSRHQTINSRTHLSNIGNIGSGAISWQSKRHSVVPLSTREAEFLGQTQATKEAIWLRKLNELNMSKGKTATIICSHNQGAIALSLNGQYHSRTKHMEI
jgi:hypothetical protein